VVALATPHGETHSSARARCCQRVSLVAVQSVPESGFSKWGIRVPHTPLQT
jgi:hypothetical protein